MEHHGVLVYSGRAFPGGQAHRHDTLQSLPPDAGFLRHQELPGGHTEPIQVDCYMPGLQNLQQWNRRWRRCAMSFEDLHRNWGD